MELQHISKEAGTSSDVQKHFRIPNIFTLPCLIFPYHTDPVHTYVLLFVPGGTRGSTGLTLSRPVLMRVVPISFWDNLSSFAMCSLWESTVVLCNVGDLWCSEQEEDRYYNLFCWNDVVGLCCFWKKPSTSLLRPRSDILLDPFSSANSLFKLTLSSFIKTGASGVALMQVTVRATDV